MPMDSIFHEFYNLPLVEKVVGIYAVALIGGLLGSLMPTRDARLSRGPFFTLLAAIVLLLVTNRFYFEVASRKDAGDLWQVAAPQIYINLLAGAGMALIAKARALDAMSSRGFFILSFIPGLNILLVFWPSRERRQGAERGAFGLLHGANGAACGSIILVIAYTIDHFVDNRDMDVNNNTILRTERMIELMGLEATVRQIARNSPTGMANDYLFLRKVTSDGAVIRNEWEFEISNIEGMPVIIRSSIIANTCSSPLLSPVIEAGGAIEHTYTMADFYIDAIYIDRTDCLSGDE